MENILPVTTEKATEITYITTTGIEKIFCSIGIATVTFFAFIGIVTIVILTIKSIRSGVRK